MVPVYKQTKACYWLGLLTPPSHDRTRYKSDLESVFGHLVSQSRPAYVYPVQMPDSTLQVPRIRQLIFLTGCQTEYLSTPILWRQTASTYYLTFSRDLLLANYLSPLPQFEFLLAAVIWIESLSSLWSCFYFFVFTRISGIKSVSWLISASSIVAFVQQT